MASETTVLNAGFGSQNAFDALFKFQELLVSETILVSGTILASATMWISGVIVVPKAKI